MQRPTDDELRAYLKAHAAWRSRYRQRDWEDVREFENEYGSAIVEELLERRQGGQMRRRPMPTIKIELTEPQAFRLMLLIENVLAASENDPLNRILSRVGQRVRTAYYRGTKREAETK